MNNETTGAIAEEHVAETASELDGALHAEGSEGFADSAVESSCADECATAIEETEEELYEIEVDEEDIYAYIVDEDDNEIGFILLDENGVEEEYYYADEDVEEVEVESKPRKTPSDNDEYDLGITREGVAEATADMNAIYKDGVVIASELKGAFDDIAAGFDFLKKK